MFPNPECLTSFIVWFFYLGFPKIVLKDAFWLDFGRCIKLAKIKVQNCNICKNWMVPKYSKIDLKTEIFNIFDLLQCVT